MNGADAAGAAASRSSAVLQGWIEAILAVAAHYRIACSRESIRVSAAWSEGDDIGAAVRLIARQAGMALRMVAPDLAAITHWRLPVVAQLRDGQVLVVTGLGEQQYRVILGGDQGLETTMPAQDLHAAVVALAVLRPARGAPDMRVDDYVKPFEPDWLRRIVLADLRPYRHIMLASLVVNVLSLGGIVFSRQVYDRVIPAQSYPTLYVLFGGVLIALAFALVLRVARTRITDVMGKRADIRISDLVMGHALRVRNTARPRATGTFISQLRELEQVRELMTSTTVSAIADLPFFLLFCLVFWHMAPQLVWIPLAALALLVVPSLVMQKSMRALAQASMREASLRNAVLVESVQGMEDIKVLQAEPRFLNQWNHLNAVNAESGLRLRLLTHRLGAWTHTVQNSAFSVVVFFGAPLVMSGDLTTGTLVAASILSSRMISPLAGLTQVLNRLQQARVARESLDAIMKLPVDQPEQERRIHRAHLRGQFEFRDATFTHDGKTPVLRLNALKIAPGERIAVLGRNGAGKSTLLQCLAGLIEPAAGTVLLDGVNLAHLDPADVRRDVGLVGQRARLFHGTVRDNLLLGAPNASDEDIIEALSAAGAWEFISRMPAGLDTMVMEGGAGLSGGQAQSLLLARMLIRRPQVLLLDEPTASLDEVAERRVMQTLEGLDAARTLIVATHRRSLLRLVDRILVLEAGALVLDDTRENALARLQPGSPGEPAGRRAALTPLDGRRAGRMRA